jgi:hypothetical protein
MAAWAWAGGRDGDSQGCRVGDDGDDGDGDSDGDDGDDGDDDDDNDGGGGVRIETTGAGTSEGEMGLGRGDDCSCSLRKGTLLRTKPPLLILRMNCPSATCPWSQMLLGGERIGF